jgi:hypothetical protein
MKSMGIMVACHCNEADDGFNIFVNNSYKLTTYDFIHCHVTFKSRRKKETKDLK